MTTYPLPSNVAQYIDSMGRPTPDYYRWLKQVDRFGTGSASGLPTGGTTGQVLEKASATDGDAIWHTLVKGDVGLDNVDNTSDLGKPVSTATQTALNAKANTADLGSAAFADTTDFDVPRTPSALTRTNDTNVTLTLGGTPATALLQAISITVGWSGSLSVARGGTGSTTAAGARTNLGVPLQGYLFGLTLSTAGSSGTFSVAAGKAADSTAADLLTLAAFTKTTSAWAVGSGNGGLDTGTIANSTWYHVHLIKRPDTGVVDVLVSTSATAPTLPTNYTLFRRIGSMLTNGSAQWVKFIQDGDSFTWDVPVNDFDVINPGTAAVLRALSVPAGVNTFAAIHSRCWLTTAGGAVATLFTDPAQTDTTPDFTNSQQIGNVTLSPFANIKIRTNTSRQIRIRSNFSDATTHLVVVTDGWIDARGRQA